MSIETQLQSITNKQHLHEMIDSLPEGVEGFVAFTNAEGQMHLFTYGPTENRTIVWIAQHVIASLVHIREVGPSA
jgi:hypothetical protein